MEVIINHWFKRIGFRFDALAAFLMCQQFDIDLNDIDKMDPRDAVLGWTYNAYVSYMMQRYRKPMSYKKYIRIRGGITQKKWEKVISTMQKANETGEKKKESQ